VFYLSVTEQPESIWTKTISEKSNLKFLPNFVRSASIESLSIAVYVRICATSIICKPSFSLSSGLLSVFYVSFMFLLCFFCVTSVFLLCYFCVSSVLHQSFFGATSMFLFHLCISSTFLLCYFCISSASFCFSSVLLLFLLFFFCVSFSSSSFSSFFFLHSRRYSDELKEERRENKTIPGRLLTKKILSFFFSFVAISFLFTLFITFHFPSFFIHGLSFSFFHPLSLKWLFIFKCFFNFSVCLWLLLLNISLYLFFVLLYYFMYLPYTFKLFLIEVFFTFTCSLLLHLSFFLSLSLCLYLSFSHSAYLSLHFSDSLLSFYPSLSFCLSLGTFSICKITSLTTTFADQSTRLILRRSDKKIKK